MLIEPIDAPDSIWTIVMRKIMTWKWTRIFEIINEMAKSK